MRDEQDGFADVNAVLDERAQEMGFPAAFRTFDEMYARMEGNQFRRKVLGVQFLDDDVMRGVRQFAREKRPVELLEVVLLEIAAAHGLRPERLLALAAMDAPDALRRHRYESARVPVGVVRAMHRGSAREDREGNVFPVTGAQQLIFGDMQGRADEVVRVPIAAVLPVIIPLRRAEFLEVFDLFGGQGLVDDVRFASFVAVEHAARIDAGFIRTEHTHKPTEDLPHFVSVDDRVRAAEHSPQTRTFGCGTVGFVDQKPMVCHKIMCQQRIEGPTLIEIDAENVGADEVHGLTTVNVLCAPAKASSDCDRDFIQRESDVLEFCREKFEIIRAGAGLVFDLAIDGELHCVRRRLLERNGRFTCITLDRYLASHFRRIVRMFLDGIERHNLGIDSECPGEAGGRRLSPELVQNVS